MLLLLSQVNTLIKEKENMFSIISKSTKFTALNYMSKYIFRQDV